tara:strand:+ start:304 stop:498 length:195 start_codon:yes stop_codon:yes gene_type:complete
MQEARKMPSRERAIELPFWSLGGLFEDFTVLLVVKHQSQWKVPRINEISAGCSTGKNAGFGIVV